MPKPDARTIALDIAGGDRWLTSLILELALLKKTDPHQAKLIWDAIMACGTGDFAEVDRCCAEAQMPADVRVGLRRMCMVAASTSL